MKTVLPGATQELLGGFVGVTVCKMCSMLGALFIPCHPFIYQSPSELTCPTHHLTCLSATTHLAWCLTCPLLPESLACLLLTDSIACCVSGSSGSPLTCLLTHLSHSPSGGWQFTTCLPTYPSNISRWWHLATCLPTYPQTMSPSESWKAVAGVGTDKEGREAPQHLYKHCTLGNYLSHLYGCSGPDPGGFGSRVQTYPHHNGMWSNFSEKIWNNVLMLVVML